MQEQGSSMRTAERMVDDIYRGGAAQVSRDEIVKKAEAEPLAPDVMYYFSHLPEGRYSKRKLVETVNDQIHQRGRESRLGLLHG